MRDSLNLHPTMKSLYSPKNHTGISYLFTLFKRLVLVFIVLLISRVAFYLYNGYLFPETGWYDMPLIFRGGIRFDLSALFYMNGLYLILALLPFPFIFSRSCQILLKFCICLLILPVSFFSFLILSIFEQHCAGSIFRSSGNLPTKRILPIFF